jgi:ribose 5-phosphate isomerase B
MKFLCVCTGNTCRSPMLAAFLARDLAASGRSGDLVLSAGSGAYPGQPATTEALREMQRRGLDLSAHRSRECTSLNLQDFDRILCMTSSHAAYVRSKGVPARRITVLHAERGGVPDPYGGTPADYAACADLLEQSAAAIAAEPLTAG